MNQICLVIPITPGKSDDARDFMRELEHERKPDYDQSERRIGITKEVWYLARTPGHHVRDVSAETLCAEFHKPFPRKRLSACGWPGTWRDATHE